MSLIVKALSESDIRLYDILTLSTSEPFQPEHAQNSTPSTSEPILIPKAFLPQDFQPPVNNPVDYSSFFS